MRTFNHVLFFACLALLGVVAVIQGLPAVGAAKAQQQTVTLTAPREEIRQIIGEPLQEALAMARKGNYREAQQRINGLKSIPDINAREQWTIDQVSAAIHARLQGMPHPI